MAIGDPVNYPQEVRRLLAQHLEEKGENIPLRKIYVVWFSYVLGGWKALLSTTVEDSRYYEVTHNPNKNETYIDTYLKGSNVVIKDNESKE